jgi:hypothetical protein
VPTTSDSTDELTLNLPFGLMKALRILRMDVEIVVMMINGRRAATLTTRAVIIHDRRNVIIATDKTARRKSRKFSELINEIKIVGYFPTRVTFVS